ncbi:MAG: cell filamentation protein Fic, partial [Eubacteriales bacterium]|nr:cell filamentation protein Fic [Eubacteriales bacterium]
MKENYGKKKKSLQIRNSTAEFLIFASQANENTIEVRVEDETVWLTQKLIAELFGVEVNTINYHLKEIFKSEELSPEAVIRKIRITA